MEKESLISRRNFLKGTVAATEKITTLLLLYIMACISLSGVTQSSINPDLEDTYNQKDNLHGVIPQPVVRITI
jgi:hypothetical protein